MSVALLKPPPKFVKDPRAWAYALNKLAVKQDEDGKRRLDEGGNPLNYAAAAAIYKNVVAKYGDSVPEVAGFVTLEPATRPEVLAMEARIWTVAHNSAWSANDTAHQRLYHAPAVGFVIERYEDDEPVVRGLSDDDAEWLVRDHEQALAFVRAVLS